MPTNSIDASVYSSANNICVLLLLENIHRAIRRIKIFLTNERLDYPQEIASSLQRGLRPRAQGPLRWHSDSGVDHNLPDPLLRPHLAARAGQPRRDRGERLRADALRYVHPGDVDWHVPDAQAALRRRQKSRARQHPPGGRADRHVHLLHVHHHRRPLHPAETHGPRPGHRSGQRGPDHLSNHLHPGRVQTLGGHRRADTPKTGQGDRDVSVGNESGHVGYQHSGEVPRGIASRAVALLRLVGVDDHHPRFDAAGHLLQIPQHRVLVRGVEAGLQGQADLHVTQEVPRDRMEDRKCAAAAQEPTVEASRHRGERSGVFHMIERNIESLRSSKMARKPSRRKRVRQTTSQRVTDRRGFFFYRWTEFF